MWPEPNNGNGELGFDSGAEANYYRTAIGLRFAGHIDRGTHLLADGLPSTNKHTEQ